MSPRRRRGYSDEALDNVRLKNSRAGYLSRVTTLRRSIEPLFSDIRNVNEVAEKILEIDNAFHCFEKAHYDYIATISDDAEEWQREARYFTEQTRKKVDFDARVENGFIMRDPHRDQSRRMKWTRIRHALKFLRAIHR